MFDDHIVDPLFRTENKKIADEARKRFVREKGCCPCVATAIEELAGNYKFPKTGVMELQNSEQFPESPYAYVEFRPNPVMHFDRRLWRNMKAGQHDARFTGAHELGHVFLHKAFVQGFHGSPKAFAMAHGEDRSAENQANQFAMFFLIRDEDILTRHSETEIAIDCGVPLEFVQQRITLFELMNRIACAEWRSRSFELDGFI